MMRLAEPIFRLEFCFKFRLKSLFIFSSLTEVVILEVSADDDNSCKLRGGSLLPFRKSSASLFCLYKCGDSGQILFVGQSFFTLFVN